MLCPICHCLIVCRRSVTRTCPVTDHYIPYVGFHFFFCRICAWYRGRWFCRKGRCRSCCRSCCCFRGRRRGRRCCCGCRLWGRLWRRSRRRSRNCLGRCRKGRFRHRCLCLLARLDSFSRLGRRKPLCRFHVCRSTQNRFCLLFRPIQRENQQKEKQKK